MQIYVVHKNTTTLVSRHIQKSAAPSGDLWRSTKKVDKEGRQRRSTKKVDKEGRQSIYDVQSHKRTLLTPHFLQKCSNQDIEPLVSHLAVEQRLQLPNFTATVDG
ncbi:hypothetical protein LSAT2_003065 [Lamellibrachia satsuma]|nr:hypothetical protein LSAT2_003065 [Lamellibrachia satsuma]